jgi:hypothetical protein
MRCAGVILVSSVSGSPAVASHTYNLSDSIEASAKRDVYNDYQFICGDDSTCVHSSPSDGAFGSDLDCVGSTRIRGVSGSTVSFIRGHYDPGLTCARSAKLGSRVSLADDADNADAISSRADHAHH